jgi:hypothetical protein
VDHLVHRKKLLKDIMALHTIDFNNYEGKGEDKEGWRSKGTALVPSHPPAPWRSVVWEWRLLIC